MDDFYKNMNNVVVTYNGTRISIAHHRNDNGRDQTEVALMKKMKLAVCQFTFTDQP